MAHQPPAFEQLVALALGELSPAQAAQVQEAAQASPGARLTLAHLSRLIADLRAGQSEIPPADLVRRVKALWELHQPVAPDLRSDRIRRLVGRLVFDSRAGASLAGFRGAPHAHHLLYTSEIADVDLQIAPAGVPGMWRVLGQVEAVDPWPAPRVALRLSGSPAPTTETTSDPHGGFSFQVEPGSYEVVLHWDAAVLALPATEVG